MKSAGTLNAMADMLVRNRMASLQSVWSLGIRDALRAARLMSPVPGDEAPDHAVLEALMQRFPDTDRTQKDGRDGEL